MQRSCAPGGSIASTAGGRRTLSRLAAAVRGLFAPTIAAAARLRSAPPPPPPACSTFSAPLRHAPLAEAGCEVSTSALSLDLYNARWEEEEADPSNLCQLFSPVLDGGDGCTAAPAAASSWDNGWGSAAEILDGDSLAPRALDSDATLRPSSSVSAAAAAAPDGVLGAGWTPLWSAASFRLE
jgi:hypothetical protein